MYAFTQTHQSHVSLGQPLSFVAFITLNCRIKPLSQCVKHQLPKLCSALLFSTLVYWFTTHKSLSDSESMTLISAFDIC